MRRGVGTLLGATVAASLFAAAPAQAAHGAAAKGLAPVKVRGASAIGRVPRAKPMSMTVVLEPRHRGALSRRISSGAKPLGEHAYMKRFGPTRKTVRSVKKWANARDLRVLSVAPNRALVRLRGSAAKTGSALGTTFERLRAPDGRRFFTVDRAARLPASFASRVASIVGLTNLGRFHVPHPISAARKLAGSRLRRLASRAAAPSINYPASYGPQDLWSLYNAPSTQTGAGQDLAIITEGDVSQPRADLATFEQHFGLPTVAWNQINVGSPSNDTSGDDEWDLDSQYSTGFAPGASRLDVYVGSSLSNDDILATINRWVSDNISRQGSFSAGECESLAEVSGFVGGLDAVLSQAAAQGQTMFFSSGDTGSQCAAIVGVNGVPVGLPGVSYPASSPVGMGVGGTTVLGPGPTEIAWYAGGGGASFFEPVPSYQAGAGGSFVGVKRGVPDVSLDADPESGYEVVVGGQVETIGGTSASAPSWQGIWARAQGAHGGTLGFAGPVIYGEPASAFNDIVLGTIGLYPATPGWDYATGRGTPNITSFVNGA